MTPLIEADRTFAVSAAIMVIVSFGLWAERRPWGQKLGGPLLLIAIAMVAANVGIIPHSAPVYGQIANFLVPLAIPLLLLRADFRTIYRESGPMFFAFIVATVATVAGSIVGVSVIDMGASEPEIAGTVTASYIGGSLNFVATAQALGIQGSAIYVAGLSADAVGAVFFLLALMALPAFRFVRRAMPSRFIEQGRSPSRGESTARPAEAAPFKPSQAANGLAVSLLVCAAGAALTSLFELDSLFILVVTGLALLVANFGKPLLRHVSSEFELGTLFMYVFFVAIGAGADFGAVLEAALPILFFILVMVAVHLCLLVVIGKLMKLDLAEVMIAANACILGPAPAAALAASRGWQPLVAPGILVGMFGYAIATPIGVALAGLFSL